MKDNKLKLVLCWHMHQPHYKDGLDGEYHLPWVYLHAIKDYTDMAAFLEENPHSQVVVNYTPVLLEQLQEYAAMMRQWLKTGKAMNDPLLNLVSGATPIPDTAEQKSGIIAVCRRANAPTMIETLPDFKALHEIANYYLTQNSPSNQIHEYLNDQFYIDMLIWYHIAWTGSSLRKTDDRLKQLMCKGRSFSAADQRLLVEIMVDSIEQIIPRYKQLQDQGQIEISMTPYGHPIVPLLIDFRAMQDSQPDAPLPKYETYPGGYGRSSWHMAHGIEIFKQHFDCAPRGVWLSEGALSSDALNLLDTFNIQWTATGESVWRNSCKISHIEPERVSSKQVLFQPVNIQGKVCRIFFRDDGLSDLIGFQYKNWDPENAVDHFIQNLENIRTQFGDSACEHVVSVILDGENAWEYYPDNRSHFLPLLYKKLSNHPHIAMTTFSDALKQSLSVLELSRLNAGSWVYGSFSTWIGLKEKNHAWDLLVEAKYAYDQVIASGKLATEQIKQVTKQLAICEGSDWFWWFGDYNPSESVKDFDKLYRQHLKKLYYLLNLEPPAQLEIPISQGSKAAEGSGTMRCNA